VEIYTRRPGYPANENEREWPGSPCAEGAPGGGLTCFPTEAHRASTLRFNKNPILIRAMVNADGHALLCRQERLNFSERREEQLPGRHACNHAQCFPWMTRCVGCRNWSESKSSGSRTLTLSAITNRGALSGLEDCASDEPVAWRRSLEFPRAALCGLSPSQPAPCWLETG